MLTKQWISLLILPGLIAVPIGIATAGEIDVQTDNVRVQVGQEGGVRIESKPMETKVVRTRKPINRQKRQGRSRVLEHSRRRNRNLQCNRSVSISQSTQTNNSGTTIDRTYTSTKTTTCQ